MERNQRVLALSLPPDPKRKDTSTNDNGGDDVSLAPFALLPSSKGEWDEEESDGGDKEDGTDDVELPEEVRSKVLQTHLLEGGSVACEGTGSGSSSTGND